MGNIALFGGTFNPIHNEHIKMIRHIACLPFIDKVLVMPTHIPPHKTAICLASDNDRLTMCSIVLKDMEKVEVSDFEIKREGKSYTFYTIEALKKEYPDDKFYVVCGGDMAITLDTWHRYDELKDICSFLVINRPDTDTKELKSYTDKLCQNGADILFTHCVTKDISSTLIREKLKKGEEMGDIVDEKVLEFIKNKKLYEGDEMFGNYVNEIKKLLTESRFNHSMEVAKRARYLAEVWGQDKDKAYLAGLLHDITKNLSDDEQLKLMASSDIMLTDVDFASKKIWHSISGSIYIKEKLGIKDEEILSAVRYHTTGKANMSLFEKVIYIADLTSTDRAYSDVETVRMLSEKDIDEAVLYVLKFTLCNLSQKELIIHKDTLEAYNFLIFERKKNSGTH